MRSILEVQAGDRDGLDAALSAGADAVSIGWVEREDDESLATGVAEDLRHARLAAHPPLLFVRLPSIETAGIDDILAELMKGEPDAIVLGACRGARDLQQLGVKLAVHEAECGLEDGETSIIAGAGAAARDLFNLGSYAESSPRLMALVWDGTRLADELGLDVQAPSSDAPLLTARHMTLFAARAAGVALVDGGSDGSGDDLRTLCRQLRAEGFNAMVARSAAQVAIINAAFDRDAERP